MNYIYWTDINNFLDFLNTTKLEGEQLKEVIRQGMYNTRTEGYDLVYAPVNSYDESY